MAGQPQTVLVNQDLRPAYYDDFHCLAADCRFSCCKGWRISFNKKDYLALKRQEGSPDLNARLEGGLRRIRTDSPVKHYGQFSMRGGACPLLREDSLCALQIEKGHEALPEVCRTFPRSHSYTSGYLERTLSPACEAVLELLWNLPEGVEFRSSPLPRKEWKGIRFQEDQPLAPYFPLIREWCVDVLQDRRFSLPSRLLLMGLGLQPLAEGETDMMAWRQRSQALLEMESVPKPDISRLALEKFLSNSLRVLMDMDVSGQDFSKVWQDVFGGLGSQVEQDAQGNVDATIPFAPYLEARARYEERFGDRTYFMENLMVTLLFHLYFPVTTSPEALWKSYTNLCNLYSVYRFLAVMSCRKGAPGDKAELFRLTLFASRGLIHNQNFRNRLRDELFQNDSSTLAHMAILLCG